MEYTKRFDFITEEMKQEVYAQVERVIVGKLIEVEIDAFRARDIDKYLRDKYHFNGMEECDINGWEGDASYGYMFDGKLFYLSASAYYGGVRFSVADESDFEEDEESEEDEE